MNWNLPNPFLRKDRSNKGKKRGPRGPSKKSPSTRGVAVPTGFLNTKRRIIMMTGQGKYISKTSNGGKVYNPKAKFHKSPGGTERATKYLKNLLNIPLAIRPKFDRKERSNILKKRGPYVARVGGVRVLPVKRKAFITEMFEGYPAKRGRGRPRKVRSVGPVMRNILRRKARKEKLRHKHSA